MHWPFYNSQHCDILQCVCIGAASAAVVHCKNARVQAENGLKP